MPFAFVPFNIRLLYACNALPHSCKYICFPFALFASISFCLSLCRFRFSLSFCFGTAVSRCCSQAFILHCALFTATFSVDFLTPDFLIGIQYFRYVHYAFKCELSALSPPPSPSLTSHSLSFCTARLIYYFAWPLANCERIAENARKFNVSLVNSN